MTSDHLENGKQMLRSFCVAQNADYFQGKNLGKVELVPLIDFKNGEVFLEFRIGVTTRYVVRNIPQFCLAVQHHSTVNFGSRLSIKMDRAAFTPRSLQILDYLMFIYKELQYQKSEALYGGSILRSLSLSPAQLSELFLLYQNKEIQTIRKTKICLHIENPRLHVEILRQDDQIVILGDYFEVFRARDSYAILIDNDLYLADPQFSRDMEPYLRAAAADLDTGILIPEPDWPVFGSSVLPILQKYGDVSIEDGLLDAFSPKNAKVRMMINAGADSYLECCIETDYEDQTYNVFDPVKLGDSYRDVAKESRAIQCVHRFFPKINRKKKHFFLDNDDELYDLIEEGFTQMESIGEVLVDQNIRKLSVQPSPHITVGLSLKSDLLQMTITSDEFPYEELTNLLESYRQKKHYLRMKDGQFLKLEDNSLQAIAEILDTLHLTSTDLRTEEILLPRYRAVYLNQILKSHPDGIISDRSSEFRALVRQIKTFEDSEFVVPGQIKKVLRTYQKYGYLWMRTIDKLGFGGILADDMGLGKTVQVIALLCSYRLEEPENKLPSLVVCPSSLVYNWESEIGRFAPDLAKSVITGGIEERKRKFKEACEIPGNILITSYDLIKRDLEMYKEQSFRYQIIDEAQMIKNHLTQTARAVKKIPAVTRFALTGTPIENRLSELWSIFDYLMTGMLGSYSSFQSDFETAIIKSEDADKAQRLRNMIYPFVLRRLKSDVLKELPPKNEINVYAAMEADQRSLYNASLLHLKGIIGEEEDSNRIQILAELMRIREICCDPSLVYDNYNAGSAKLDVCMRLIEEAIDGGHKVLLFSQFTSMLDIIAENLTKRSIEYYMLTGSVSKEKRLNMVRDFHNTDTSVFLISLKAGGTGLNLTAADIVIHYDPWWNLAAQNQATDRAYRIGQKNKVTVYKLIMKDTIEERILKLQENKEALSRQIITDETSQPVITKALLEEILG